MKAINYVNLYLYFDNRETLLSAEIEKKTTRMLYQSERRISESDLLELFRLKVRLAQLIQTEADLLSLCMEYPNI